jgi:hypothetical protein
MSRILHALLASAVSVAAVLLVAVSPATASAGGGCANFPSWPGPTCPTHPVVPWEAAGWRNLNAVPTAMYTGRHAPNSRPYLLFIVWDNWKRASGYGHGYLQRPAGQYRVSVLLYRIRAHGSSRYFSRMTWWRHSNGVREKTRWAFRDREWVRMQFWHAVR